MKVIIIAVFAISLLSCKGENETDKNVLTGTWKYTITHENYSIETDEYLYTNYIESTLIITEESGEIKYSSCWEYGINDYIAIKTDSHLSNINGYTFILNEDGSYSTEKDKGNINYPGISTEYYDTHLTLSKISDDVIIDKGLLVLNGPVAVTEYNHACLSHHYSNLFSENIYELTVPYDDRYLNFRLELASKPSEGAVVYSDFTSEDPVSDFFISSNATVFWETVNSNLLAPDTADFNFIESTDMILSGTYSFTVNSENYNGEFQIELNQ